MAYVPTLKPRLLFSYTGKPPYLSGAKNINEMEPDDAKGWRYIHEYCGGNKATKRIIEAKMVPILGPLDWGNDDMDKPLDLGHFFGEVTKLQNGQRFAALTWAHIHNQGQNVRGDPQTVMMTRKAYCPGPPGPCKEEILLRAKAANAAQKIEDMHRLYEAQVRAAEAGRRVNLLAAELMLNRNHVEPVIADMRPVVGRSPPEMTLWKKLFNYVDQKGKNTVSKYEINSLLAPQIGAFSWDGDDDKPMRFPEFVDLMTFVVPVEKRYSTLHWIKSYCPDKVFPINGGAPYYTSDYTHTLTVHGARA